MFTSSESFSVLMAVVAMVAGAIASVSGFGIGSLLTPVLSVRVGTKLAVAAVAIPHFAATALRFWIMRKHVDRRLLWSFGLMSAAGGLMGALLQSFADTPALTVVLGGLLIFTGVMGLTGLSGKLRCWDQRTLARKVPGDLAILVLSLGVVMLFRFGR